MNGSAFSLPILESATASGCEQPSFTHIPSEVAPSKADLAVVVPPSWELSFQSLGIPALAAWARRLGYATDQVDLNVAFHRWICGGPRVSLEFVRQEYDRIISSEQYRTEYERRRDDTYIRIDLP